MSGQPNESLSIQARSRLIRQASLIALLGNATLAALKITAGILAHSLAVLGDGIDSSTDVAISLVSLAISVIIARPADKEHPWGHSRAETVGTTVLAFTLFFAAGQLLLSSLSALTATGDRPLPGVVALAVSLVSILGKSLIMISQFTLARRSGSAMLRANGVNMRNDIILSATVLIGVFLSRLLRLPKLDLVVAILVSLWVLRSAVVIFKEANLELMDGVTERGPYLSIFEAVRSVPGVNRPHRVRVRRIASKWDIDLDIEVDGSLCVRQAHELAVSVEREIKKRLPEVYDVMIHVEPDESPEHPHDSEAYGLSEQLLSSEKS